MDIHQKISKISKSVKISKKVSFYSNLTGGKVESHFKKWVFL